MIAHLGMYDPPALRRCNDMFWQAIRHFLGYGPPMLTRRSDFDAVWHSPDLLLSQTCGYPYRDHLHGKVGLVGTLDYGLPDCAPGYYFSVLVAASNDTRGPLHDFNGARLAFNEPLSQSGWAAPVHHMLCHNTRPGALIETGAHQASALAVAEGRADIAGIDALTFALLTEHEPDLIARLRVVGHTSPTPGLPLITSLGSDIISLREAIGMAIRALPDDTRTALHLRGLVQIPPAHYLSVATPPGPDELLR